MNTEAIKERERLKRLNEERRKQWKRNRAKHVKRARERQMAFKSTTYRSVDNGS